MSANAQTAPSVQELQARIAQLEAEKAARKPKFTVKVAQKGGVSVYGLGRFPVTLYAEQWDALLSHADEIRQFIAANKSALKFKE